MKRILFIFIISVISVYGFSAGNAGVSAADETGPYVRFSVTAEKEIEADIILVQLQVEKKDKSFSIASSECSKTVNKLSDTLKKTGINDKDIVIRKFGTYPNRNFWGKEYSVNQFVEVRLRDKDLLDLIIKTISSVDPQISINNLTFDVEKKDAVKAQLIREAADIAEQKRKTYEEAFHSNLKLFSVEEMESYVNNMTPRPEIGYMKASMDSGSTMERLPLMVFKLTLNVRYSAEVK